MPVRVFTRKPSDGRLANLDQLPDRLLLQIFDFDTGFTELGRQHKAGLKFVVRTALFFHLPPLIFCEGMASVHGNQKQNEQLAAGREDAAEQYLYGLLLGILPIDADKTDSFMTSLAEVGQPLDRRRFPFQVLPGGQSGRVVISTLPGMPARPVVMLNGRAEGSMRHQAFRAKTGGRDDLNNMNFRAVMLSVTSAERPLPPPPAPVDPTQSRIFKFRMRISPQQPDPISLPAALKTALGMAKLASKSPALRKALEELQGLLPKIDAFMKGVGGAVRLVTLVTAALGIELIGFDIMDDQTGRGARYVYFGIAPSTDFIVDLALGLMTDFVTKWIGSHQNLPLGNDFERELFDMLVKAGFKPLVDRLKELADLRLTPPFPFTSFTAASVPIARIFIIGLDDFQGGFSEVRVGGTLTVMFEEGIGAQRPINTAPPHIVLRSGSSGGLSRRFGLSGVIVKGADIPFER